MYKLNLLQRNVLITPDEVIFHAPTKHTIDPRPILNSIIVAEERFIRPLLGFEYYYALVDKKNLVITDANKTAQQTNFNSSRADNAPAYNLKSGDILNAVEFLESEDQKLWKEQLWKLTAEAVMVLTFPEQFIQISSEGVTMPNPMPGPLTNAANVSPDLASMKWLMDKKIMDRIDPLMDALHEWVCYQKKKNTTSYLLYAKECACDGEEQINVRKSNLITGLYDDND